jgi:glycopeptide antibiotics resistance protein
MRNGPVLTGDSLGSVAAPDARAGAPAPLAAPADRPVHRTPAFAFFCVYALFVVYGTLLPFQFLTDRATLLAKRDFVNWNPLVLVTGEPTPITDLVMNVAFFVPLGFVGFHAQRRRGAAVAVLRSAAAGFLLTLGVETLQFFTPARNPATSDVLMNTGGAVLGALLAAAFHGPLETALRRRLAAWVEMEPLLPILLGYGVLVVVAALLPFDFATGIPWIKRGLRVVRLDPRGDPPFRVEDVHQILRYAVLAGLGFRAMQRLCPPGSVLGVARRAVHVALAATCLGAGLELAQVLVRSRVCSGQDALAAAAGAAIGVTAALLLAGSRRRSACWNLVGLAYVGWIAAQALAPFRFEFDPAAMRERLTFTALIPYSSYYYRANLAALTDFLEGLLAFVPLAFVLAETRSTRVGRVGLRGAAGIVALCATYALALEILQLGVPKRYPEISDVLTAALGAGLGAYAWRWLAHVGVRVERNAARAALEAALRRRGCEAATAPTAPASS